MERFKQISEGIWEDQETGLQWTKTFKKMIWQDAMDFCQNLDYGGYSDWKLPTDKELEFVVDRSKLNPATNLLNTVSSRYWSSTTNASNTDIAWNVYFSNGCVGLYYKSNSYYVRAVRGGQH